MAAETLTVINENIRGPGSGIFIQSGGTNTVTGLLTVDTAVVGSGAYELLGGTLNAPQVINNGSLDQTVGTFIPGLLVNNASVDQSGGTLNAISIGGTFGAGSSLANAGQAVFVPGAAAQASLANGTGAKLQSGRMSLALAGALLGGSLGVRWKRPRAVV